MDQTPDNQDNSSPWQYTGGQTTFAGTPQHDTPAQKPTSEPISWTASEYIAHEKSANWYIAMFGGGGVIVALIFIATRDWFASAVVLIAITILSVVAGRAPLTKKYSIEDDTLFINETTYHLGNFRSFSIVEEGVIDSIWLKPLKKFTPTVVMYFDPKDEDVIIDRLSAHLPNEPRSLDNVDLLMKKLKF